MSLSQWMQEATVFRVFDGIVYPLHFPKNKHSYFNLSSQVMGSRPPAVFIIPSGLLPVGPHLCRRPVLKFGHSAPAEVWTALALTYHTNAYTTQQRSLAFFLVPAECCLTSLSPTCLWLHHLWTFFYVHWFLQNSNLVLKKMFMALHILQIWQVHSPFHQSSH